MSARWRTRGRGGKKKGGVGEGRKKRKKTLKDQAENPIPLLIITPCLHTASL